MKKLFAILLAAMMVLSMTTIAFAADDAQTEGETTYTDGQGASFKLKYTGEGKPAATFTFTAFTPESVTDAAAGVTKDNMPVPTKIADQAFTTENEKTVAIALPEYSSVGVYTYSFAQNPGNTQGITYYTQQMKLVVTVIEGENGKIKVAAVHVSSGDSDTDKTGEIENTYESKTLTVTKTVTGTMGDKTKDFSVTVTLTPAEGKELTSAITHTANDKVGTVNNEDGTYTFTFNVKNGATISFANIPIGAKYTVDEADYSAEEYETSGEVTEATELTADTTVGIINHKDGNIDTGIVLDSLPYILIGAVAMAAAVVMIAKKRRVED